jgi:PKD repeat protein
MRKFLITGVLALIVACETSKPPLENQNPIAAFTANTTVQAGTPLNLVSSSSDPDGDTLTLSWDFGDGVRGGGASIAHEFVKAGSYSVKLTASDSKGGISSEQKSIAVTASNVLPGTNLNVVGTIIDATGAPLAGVSVNLEGSVLGSSDANGKVTVAVPTGIPLNLLLSKMGFAQSFAALEFPIGSNASNANFKATMPARGVAQPLNASTGGTITGLDNARLELPANALETPNGTPVTGAINVSLTPVDINDEKEKYAFPGSFTGIQQNGVTTGIVSLGTTEFALEQNGQRLNLKPGASAKVRLPMYANTNLDGSSIKLGDTIPLWSLNEITGDWVQEGNGIVVDSGAGTRALDAVVTHFSWWNADMGFTPSNAKPKCINDTPGQYDSIFEQAVFCKFLAEIEKPIPEQKISSRQTVPNLPAYAATAHLPIAGGLTLAVPAGVNVRYTGCIANGTFCGSVVKNFAAGSSETIEIRLKPTDLEVITLPFDTTRNFGNTKRFKFDSALNPNGVNIRIERTPGSSFIGTAVLFDPQSTELVSKNIGTDFQSIETQLFTTGSHLLEIRPGNGSSGSLRIRVERQNFSNTSTWTTLLQTPDEIENQPKLILNTAGQGTAFWVRKQQDIQSVYYPSISVFDGATNTWNNAQILDTQAISSNLSTAISSNNDRIAIWTGRSGTQNVLRFSRRAANAATWNAAITFETSLSNTYAINPQIRMDSQGNALAVWLEYGGIYGNRIRVARFTVSTETWLVQTISAGSFPTLPILAMNASGQASLIYNQLDQSVGQYRFFVRQYNASLDTWGIATPVFNTGLNAPALGCECAAFEISNNGNAIALWDAGTLRARAYDLGANTWKPEQSFAGTNAKLGLDANGDANLVYLEFANPSALLARTYNATTDTWSTSQTISDSSNGGVNFGLNNLNAAFNPTGDAVTVFLKGSEALTSAKSSSASTWTTPATDGVFETRRVALDDVGRAVILRLGYNQAIAKYEIQTKRISIR